MPDDLPDRLSNNPRSPFFKEDVLRHDIGVRFNGAEKTNVEEYCISEGWIRVEVGKTRDRYGNPMTVRLNGKVEPYLKDAQPQTKPEPRPETMSEAKAETKPASQPKPARPDKPEKAAKPPKPGKEAKPDKAAKAAKAAKAGKAKPDKKKAKKK